MKIGIDARLYSQSGIGRYISELIESLSEADSKNTYYIYLSYEDFNSLNELPKNFIKRKAFIRWHSLAEQLIYPLILMKDKLDLMHFTYFSVPFIYPRRFVLTVHDLIIDHYRTGKASTHSPIIYYFKIFFYKIITFFSVFRAKKIIAVSEATKKEIICHYHVNPEKIAVVYEAVGSALKSVKHRDLSQIKLFSYPYLLYVGNAYPHKNISLLIKGMTLLKSKYPKLKLLLAGKSDYFYQRLRALCSNNSKIIFFGQADDKELASLYQKASAFVFPSLMEGFGFPPLEAMFFGCPSVVSDINSLREICGKGSLYFDPKSAEDLAEKVSLVLDSKKTRGELIKNGYSQVKKYSWSSVAKKTLALYQLASK